MSHPGISRAKRAIAAFATQQPEGTGSPDLLELFWEPEKTTLATRGDGTPTPAIKFQSPGGLSGSLVWNTRILEVTQAGRNWTPEDAVVTGLLKRLDEKTKILLVLPADQFWPWLHAEAPTIT